MRICWIGTRCQLLGRLLVDSWMTSRRGKVGLLRATLLTLLDAYFFGARIKGSHGYATGLWGYG